MRTEYTILTNVLVIYAHSLTRVASMARAVADGYSHPAREGDLRGLDKWAYDFVLKPLLLAVELEDTRSESARVYGNLCSALLRGEFAHEVPIYLTVLKAVEGGGEFASAISNDRMALYEAGQRHKAAQRHKDGST
jgi:hypothetical protein